MLYEGIYIANNLLRKRGMTKHEYIQYYKKLSLYTCEKCGKRNQPYMLKRELFKLVSCHVGTDTNSFICLACVRKVLKRDFTYYDFNWSNMNRRQLRKYEFIRYQKFLFHNGGKKLNLCSFRNK